MINSRSRSSTPSSRPGSRAGHLLSDKLLSVRLNECTPAPSTRQSPATILQSDMESEYITFDYEPYGYCITSLQTNFRPGGMSRKLELKPDLPNIDENRNAEPPEMQMYLGIVPFDMTALDKVTTPYDASSKNKVRGEGDSEVHNPAAIDRPTNIDSSMRESGKEKTETVPGGGESLDSSSSSILPPIVQAVSPMRTMMASERPHSEKSSRRYYMIILRTISHILSCYLTCTRS